MEVVISENSGTPNQDHFPTAPEVQSTNEENTEMIDISPSTNWMSDQKFGKMGRTSGKCAGC